jgi:hypothetical protein
MATALVVVVAGGGCGSSESAPAARLNGTWLWSNGALTAEAWLTFDAKDGTYTAKRLDEMNPRHGEFETGVYTAQDDQVTLIPRTFTCPEPDPAYTFSYRFSGTAFIIQTPQGFLTQAPGSVLGLVFSPFMPQSDDGIIVGCFQPDGTFVESPRVSVGGA